MQKIPTRLCGTNIFTSSACFAPSFVKQPNGAECTQMVRNAIKRQFRVQWVGSGAFVAKNSDTTSWHERTSSARFAPIFVRHPNGPECTQWYETHQNISLGANGVDRVHSLRKILTRLHGTNYYTSSARFAPSFAEFREATKRFQTHPNSTKRTKNAPDPTHWTLNCCFGGPMGWIGCVGCETFLRDFVARTFALVRPVFQ